MILRNKERVWELFFKWREELRHYAARHAISLIFCSIALLATWGWILLVAVVL